MKIKLTSEMIFYQFTGGRNFFTYEIKFAYFHIIWRQIDSIECLNRSTKSTLVSDFLISFPFGKERVSKLLHLYNYIEDLT